MPTYVTSNTNWGLQVMSTYCNNTVNQLYYVPWVVLQVIGDYLLNATDMDDRSIHLLFSANRWEKRAEMLDKLKKGSYKGNLFFASSVEIFNRKISTSVELNGQKYWVTRYNAIYYNYPYLIYCEVHLQ